MDDLDWLHVLVLMILSGFISCLLMIGLQRVSGARRSARLTTACAELRVSPDGSIEANDEARALLGMSAEGGVDPDAVQACIAKGKESFRSGLEQLLADGAEYRTLIETTEGRVLQATGAVFGVDVSVVLSDQTDLRSRLTAAETRAEEAQQELEFRRSAQKAAGIRLWREGEEESVSLDAEMMAALRPAIDTLRSDSGGGGRRHVTVDLDDGVTALELIEAEKGCFVALDASRARAAERSMTRFVDMISETFAHLKVGLMIFDADRRLTMFNPVIVRLCNEDSLWLARQPSLRDILDRMRRARSLPEPADYAAWRTRLLNRVGAGLREPYEETWYLPDGRTLKAIFRPHTAGGLAMVIEDETEALALRRTNAVERAATEVAADMLDEGVLILSPDGRVRKANSAFRRLWQVDERRLSVGHNVDQVISLCVELSGPHRFWEEMKSSVSGAGGGKRAGADAIALSDGRRVSARVSPMPDGAIMAVFIDVTASELVAVAMKERNDALVQAEEMRSALVDQISHQMRTPLNSIFGFSQLLDGGKVGPLTTTQADYVRGIVASSSELLVAIDAMSDLISVGADAPREPSVGFDPAAALQEICGLVERRMERRGDIVVDATEAPAWIVGHRVRFRQIIFNMASDALSKAPEGCGVVFSIRAEGWDIILECRHEAMMEMEEQGLALSLVHRFTRLNGGEVRVGREADGRRLLLCRLTAAIVEGQGLNRPLP